MTQERFKEGDDNHNLTASDRQQEQNAVETGRIP